MNEEKYVCLDMEGVWLVIKKIDKIWLDLCIISLEYRRD